MKSRIIKKVQIDSVSKSFRISRTRKANSKIHSFEYSPIGNSIQNIEEKKIFDAFNDYQIPTKRNTELSDRSLYKQSSYITKDESERFKTKYQQLFSIK